MQFVSHPWINPNTIENRAYQESVVKTALTANTLCVLPTGLGKTSVAALVAAERLSKNMKGKVLFLAPTRPLVNQHKMNFERFLKLGVELAVITGETKAEERFKIYKENDIIFATPQCVTGDTNIFVKDRGIVKIQEFVESFELKECKYGNKTGFCADVDEHTTGLENNKISDVKISHVWKLPANTLYEIKTELNNCIKCTPEHPLLTINTSGKIEWKMVEDLDTNTWVAMPKKIHMAEKIIDIYSLIRNSPLKISDKKFTHSLLEKHKKLGVKRGKISRFYHNDIDIGVFFELLDMCEVEYPGKIKITNKTGRSTPIIVSKFISPEMCYLIGAMLGDGHIGDTKSKGNEVVFSAIADKDVLEKFRQYVIETFGIIPKLDSRKGLVYYSTAMAHVMNALGVPFGKKAGIIRVPNYIFGLPECHILKFIGSLFDTDGSASKHSINVVSTISKDFAEDVRWLLLRLGMVSYLHKSGRSETVIRAKKYKTHHIYNVVISGEAQINRFIELCEPDYRKIKKAVEGLSLIKRHGTRSKDIVPIQTALQEAYLDHRKFGGAPSNEILMAYHHKYLSTSSLSNLLIKMNSSKAREIENLLSLPIRWVRIKSIKKIHSKTWVYDLTVENSHNFIGNFLVSHNTVRNDIKSDIIDLSDFSLVIFDEAHRCIGQYSYVYIAKVYMNRSKDPLILALTASPGGQRYKINEVRDRLFINNVEIKTREDEDVKPYVQAVKNEWITVEMPIPFRSIHAYLSSIKNARIKKLMGWHVINSIHINKTQLLRLQEQLAKKKTGYAYGAMSLIAEIIKVDHAMLLLETQCLHALQSYFKKLSVETTKATTRLLNEENFKNAMRLTEELIDEGEEHPKLEKLKTIIEEEMKNKDARIIVFAQFRDTISKIHEVLGEIKGAAPIEFIGQAKKKGKGLSQKEQIQILNEFKMGFYNILCASQVAEEGLDVVETNVVIFYEPTPSAVRKIQRSGRTARTKEGKVIVLMTKGTRDEAYHWSAHNKEKQMKNTLYQMQRGFDEKQKSLGEFK